MKTLIQVQEEALRKMDVSRSSQLRYAKLCRSVYRWYVAEVAKLGYVGYDSKGHSIPDATWRDVIDMRNLRNIAETEEV